MRSASKLLPNVKLTKRTVDQILATGKDTFHWDSVAAGLWP